MISGKLAELYVDLVAKDRLAPALTDMKDKVARLRADLAQVGTTGWTQGIQQFVNLQKQSNVEQQRLTRAFDIAAMGKFGVMMRDMRESFSRFHETLEKVGGSIWPVIYGVAGFTATVGAASPDALTTFTMSLQLLAASIGTALLPAFVEVIRVIQRAARWFLSLDDGTRRLIGTVALWVVGLSAAAFILARLIGFATTLLGIFRALGMLAPIGMLLGGMAALVGGGFLSRAGVPGFGGPGSSGPAPGVGLGLAATTFGAARMGAGWASIPATAPLWAAYAMSGRDGAGEGFSRFMTRALHPGAPGTRPEGTYRSTTFPGMVEVDRTEYGELGGAEFASAFRRSFRGATDEEAARIGMSPADAARARAFFEGGGLSSMTAMLEYVRGGLGAGDDSFGRMTSAWMRGEGVDATRADIRRATVISGGPELPAGVSAGLRLGAGAGAGADTVALATNFQSQFLGIEQQWKRLQTEAASDSPLAAEMREISLRSLERLVELAGYTRDIRDRPGGLGR